MLPAALVALAVAALPVDAKPGAVEALIDALRGIDTVQRIPYADWTDERIKAIHRLGFDAVPTLIEHLDDKRPTKHYPPLLNNFRPYPYAVKHFARDLLNGFIEEDGGCFAQLKGDELTKEYAEKWWAEAKKLGEENFLLQNLTRDIPEGKGIRMHLLRVVMVKHPSKLPDAFTAALKTAEREEMHFRPLVDAVAECDLPAVTKKRLLLDLLGTASWYGKANALAGLHAIGADDFRKRFVDALGELPDHPKREEPFFIGFTRFAEVASLTADAKVWAAVGEYLKRASAEVKIAWIDYFFWDAEDYKQSRTQRIKCLMFLLSDQSIYHRKNDSERDGEEVRNRAAKRLGEMLKVKTDPADEWTADDWKAFREEVAKAAKDTIKKDK